MTWGVFPGQEIAQTTIIDKESFLSWKVGFLVPTWNCPTGLFIFRKKLSPSGQTGLHAIGQGQKSGKHSKTSETKDGW